MKLRNKKTGEIAEFNNFYIIEEPEIQKVYSSLGDLSEEWEDYEGPKSLWAIGQFGELYEVSGLALNQIKKLETIGNYFETKEEAEKAVEKLKAWKRLKDKGFRFERWLLGGEYGNTITFSDYFECDDKARADLDLLFGGEE